MNYCYRCMTTIPDISVICPYCGKSVESEIPIHHLVPGTVLNGKYMVGKALGEGGFGITYVGLDLTLEIKVAIKEYYPNGYVNRSHAASSSITCGSEGERLDFFLKGKERFLNEARILAKFSSERGIVGVRDFFEANGTAYIVMEFLEGITLKDYIKQRGVLTADETISLLEPIMKSLNHVHMQNLIHRDISPDNIMLNNDEPKLLDFGAARNVSAVASKSLSVVLKPGYAPEEQYRSKGEQGPWTDVYAICATMYKCITGVTPDDATQRFYKDEVKKPSELGIKINPQVEAVLMKGMSILQNERYQNMGELLNALNIAKESENLNTGKSAGAVSLSAGQSVGVGSLSAGKTAGFGNLSAGQPARAGNRKKIFILSGIVASIVLVGIIILIVCLNNGADSNSRSVSSDQSSNQSSDQSASNPSSNNGAGSTDTNPVKDSNDGNVNNQVVSDKDPVKDSDSKNEVVSGNDPINEKDETDKEIVLTLWDIYTESDANHSVYKHAIDDLKVKYPNITIVEESTENQAYKTKIKSAVTSGELPDIFFTWAGAFLGDFVETGKVHCLDDVLQKYVDNGELSEAMLGNSTYGGKHYGVPMTMNVVGLFANMDLLAKVGYDHIPTTGPELNECCYALLKAGITPFVCAGSETWCVTEYLEPIIAKIIGAKALNNIFRKGATWNNEGIVEAVKIFQMMIEIYFDAEGIALTNDEAKAKFMNQQVAFYQNGSWNCGDFSNPDYVKFNISVGEFPVLVSGSEGQLIGGPSDTLAVSEGSNARIAAEYAVELGRLISHYGYLNGLGLPAWTPYGDLSGINPLTQKIADICGRAKGFVLYGDNALDADAADIYLKNVSLIYSMEIDGERFVKNLARDLW